jgi:hypothetical protein
MRKSFLFFMNPCAFPLFFLGFLAGHYKPPHDDDGGNDDVYNTGLSEGEFAGVIVGGVVGLLLLAAVAYYYLVVLPKSAGAASASLMANAV